MKAENVYLNLHFRCCNENTPLSHLSILTFQVFCHHFLLHIPWLKSALQFDIYKLFQDGDDLKFSIWYLQIDFKMGMIKFSIWHLQIGFKMGMI